MKRITNILIYSLFSLTALYPVGTVFSGLFGYKITLPDIPVFSLIIALLSLCTVALTFLLKYKSESKTLYTFLMILPFLSFLNGIFYILKNNAPVVYATTLLSIVCCFALTAKIARPIVLRIVSSILFGGMMFFFVHFGFFAVIFGDFGDATVVQTIESPQGTYYAQVLDIDQGLLGGSTIVEVRQTKTFNLFLFRIEHKPQRIFVGEWGIYPNLDLFWKDENHLVLEGREYVID